MKPRATKSAKKSSRHYRSLALCNCGATAIEYAIVLPTLMLLVMGIVEYCLISYALSALQNAVTIAAREGATGYSGPGQTQLQTIQSILAGRVGGLLDPNKLQINVADNAAGWGSVLPPVICSNQAGGGFPPCVQNFGAPKDVIVYSVSYPWPVVMPLMRPFLGADSNGIVELSASSIVQNEPSQVYP